MSFDNLLFGAIDSGTEISGGRYLACYKERPHISKSKLDSAGGSKYLNVGESHMGGYARDYGIRYVAVESLAYDLLFSLYDVNSSWLFAYRLFTFGRADEHVIAKAIASLPHGRLRNLEARLIGLQNGQDYWNVKALLRLMRRHKIPINEIDLFGNQLRHVAIDASLGMTFNVLLLDRVYRPGELANQQTQEQFEHERGLHSLSRAAP